MSVIKKIATSALALLLCASMIFEICATGAQEPKKLYVKEVKLIYADSEAEAKTQLPAGFVLASGNLNVSTGNDGVYVCYSTTSDPEEAITDIKVMHESGGFERTDFNSSLENAIDGVYALAEEMTVAVNEFAENYKNGVPGAVYAKEMLDYFEYDEDTLLGDFMISGKGTYREYGQMILMCHEDILNAILSLLSMGVQKSAGENWIDKLADVDPSAYDFSHDVKYRERANKLRAGLQQFNDVYCYILGYDGQKYTQKDLTADNDKEFFAKMAENSDMFVLIQSVLQSYPVGVDSYWGTWGGTAEDLFAIGLNNPLNIQESYALLDCLTPGQEIMLRLTGPFTFLINTQNTEEVLAEAKKTVEEQLDGDERVPIWEGVDLDVFVSEVGLTTEAQRSIAAGKQYDLFARDVDTLKQHYRNVASIITSAVSIASCTILITKCSLPLLSWGFAKLGFLTAASTISAFASSAIVTSVLLYCGLTFVVAGLICAIVVLFFLEDIISALTKEEYERTTIPKYMVDEILTKEGVSTYTYYRRVDNVKTDEELGLDTDENESGSDINANEGYRWMALYTSNKPSLGNPIEADIKITTNSGVTPEGYTPMTMFGKKTVVNLNSYAHEDSGKYTSVYLFYKQEATAEVKSEKLYISGIRIESASHEDIAKKELVNSGYIPIDHNFGVDSSTVIYIGYKLTGNADDAIRDIRVMYGFEGTGVTYGQLNYGSMGKIGKFDIMVSSTSANPAPPIVSLLILPRSNSPDPAMGYEPVNEFSGGLAQPLGKSEYRLYFLPETTFTTGPDYLAGTETDIYYYNTYSEEYGFSYDMKYYSVLDIYDNNFDNYKAAKNKDYGENFFDFSSATTFRRYSGIPGGTENTHVLSYKYTTTKNPYRALYGIAATSLSGLSEFNDCVMYGGIGHVLVPVEYSSNSKLYLDGEFPYNLDQNGHDRGVGCKADIYWDGRYLYQWEALHCRRTILNLEVTQSHLSENANALYIAGYQADRTPLKVNDIIFSTSLLPETSIPDNFTAVPSMIGSDDTPANVAPSIDEVKIDEESQYLGFSSKDIKERIFANPVYIYYRNEKTVNNKPVAQNSPKSGKYICGVFLSSREKIREDALKDNSELECKDVSSAIVESYLLSYGATITYNTHINTNFSKDDGFENANYVYLGISRTDDPNAAIRDIRLYVAQKGESPKKQINRTITYNGLTFDVSYTLVSKVSLTEQGNKSDEDFAKERHVYVYVSTHPALGDPITDIKMSTVFEFGYYEPVLTMDGDHFISAYVKNSDAGGASIFVDGDYFFHGNHLSVRRNPVDLPYIEELMVASDGGDGKKAVAKLIDAGFTDIINKDLNDGAGGDYIYIGMKRTNDPSKAIYDVMLTNDREDPKNAPSGYTLVSSKDLNDGAAGKYIYLYEKRTPTVRGQMPLTDLYTTGKNPVDVSTYTGNETVYLKVATNQDGDMQDLNQTCGFWSDYIYLVKVYSVKNDILGSIIGSGSFAVIAIFIAAAGVVAWSVVRRKKKASSKEEEESSSDDAE